MEKEIIIKEQVKYSGLGNFKDSYKHAYDWLIGEGFDVVEDKYEEKTKGEAKDAKIVWTATHKVTDYFRIRLEIKWEVLGMTDVEVELDGKKKSMNKFSEIKIDIRGTLEKDYTSKWGATSTQRFLKDVYHKYVIPGTTDKRKIEVVEITQQFKDEMKAFFDLICKRYS